MNTNRYLLSIPVSCIFLVALMILPHECLASESGEQARHRYASLKDDPGWQRVFFDAGSELWSEQWMLDGEQAALTNSESGLIFTAGQEEWNPDSHAVLWTRNSFKGDIKIEYDYTKLDSINKWVNILYIQASGIDSVPYARDIAEWSELRNTSYMKTYFNNMNLVHISYAAYGKNDGDVAADYIRARKYPVSPGAVFANDTVIKPDYFPSGLFRTGQKCHISVIKSGEELFFYVTNPAGDHLFSWKSAKFLAVHEGRIGLRHMWLKSSKYENFTVYTRN